MLISCTDADISKTLLVPRSIAIQIKDQCNTVEDGEMYLAWINADGSGIIDTKCTNDTTENHSSFNTLTNAHEWLESKNVTEITVLTKQ